MTRSLVAQGQTTAMANLPDALSGVIVEGLQVIKAVWRQELHGRKTRDHGKRVGGKCAAMWNQRRAGGGIEDGEAFLRRVGDWAARYAA